MKRKILVSAVLSVLLLAALAANVHATEVKITASDAVSNDQFPAEEGRETRASGDDVPRRDAQELPCHECSKAVELHTYTK